MGTWVQTISKTRKISVCTSSGAVVSIVIVEPRFSEILMTSGAHSDFVGYKISHVIACGLSVPPTA